ncbi:alpha/beta hydrolase fold domain-containing protein [Roseibacterium sp. SDUM158017]|uniref:alpha/beta hydrolase n=1 Tax=Roseicyclus salinarum TaxID=3036773 RepID=UPI0024150BC4|nr:alpha/beta hydrolase fold domain-containing protein [Roseibacterium sp. SDUM158017]MDG4648071.1 alpha/beta hydrolase fold domain-containing protein [Roseibacterium sp. SDUM158017]
MSGLTLTDRAWLAFARNIERPTLALLGSQRALDRVFRLTARMTTGTPRGTQTHRDADGSLWLTPPGVAPDAPLLFYIHGGGFTIGAPETHAGLAAHLAAAAGLRAVLPRYRLAPAHPFPAAPQDVIAAWTRLYGQGAAPVAICGDSAGGCLALLLAMHIRDNGLPAADALALIAPIADLSGDIAARIEAAPSEHLIPARWARRIRRCYLPGIDPARADVSPLLGDLRGLPRTLVQAAEGEALAEDARRLIAAMDDATLELHPGLQHVWHLHAGRSPAADAALADLGRFLKEARA